MSKLHVASKQWLNNDTSLSKSSTLASISVQDSSFLFCAYKIPTALVELHTCAEFWIFGARRVSVTQCIALLVY